MSKEKGPQGTCDDYLEHLFLLVTVCQGYERSETTEHVYKRSQRKPRLLLWERQATFSVSSRVIGGTDKSVRM